MPELPRAALNRRERLGAALEICERVLLRLGRQGLTRLSRAAVAELKALVQTAHNGGLVKLERTLESLATTVEHYLDRDPNFRPGRYVDRLNRAWLLLEIGRRVHRTEEDPAQFPGELGQYRRSYAVLEAPLTVQALGASGWVTDSGFVGITVHLRDDERDYQLSNARPADYFGNDPRRLLRYPLSDYLDLSIQDLSHGAHTLHHAKLAWDGRISVSGELDVQPAAWSGAVYDDCTASSWRAAADLLGDQLTPLEGAPARRVLLEPRGWGRLEVHPTHGIARMPLTDGAGAVLAIEVPLRPENNLLIDNLELLSKRPALRPPALFGQLRVDAGLRFQPMTAVYGELRTLKERRAPRQVNEVHLSIEDVSNLQ